MPITIGPGQLVSQDAIANYFQMLAEARRIEAEQKRRSRELLSQSISQGLSGLGEGIGSGLLERNRSKREDQRFNRQLEAQREARNQSAATQMGMSPTEYVEFLQTNVIPPTVAARAQAIQQQRLQQQVQLEQAKRQQEVEAKARDESLANLDDQYNNGRLPQDLNVRYSNALAQQAAIYGDPEYLAGRVDPDQFQSRIGAVQREIESIAKLVPRNKTNGQKLAESVVSAKTDPALKALVDSGSIDPNTAWLPEMRNGVLQFRLLDGVSTENEKAAQKLAEDKLKFEVQKFNAEQKQFESGAKGGKAKDPVDEQAKRFDQAIKYLEAIYGERQPSETWSPEQIDEGLTAVARSPEENEIKVMEDRARHRAGARRPQVEALIQQTRQARANGNDITEPEILLAQMQALIAENPGKSPQVRALLQEYRDMLALFEEEDTE